MNGDGKADLVIVNGVGGNTVSVFTNAGNGLFGARRDYRTGHEPQWVAVGDVNGDRKPDLAIANAFGDTVSVLANVTGRCAVPNVKGIALPLARTTITFAGCSVGKVRRAYSPNVYVGLVLSETPTPRTALPSRGRVNLIVSAGRRP